MIFLVGLGSRKGKSTCLLHYVVVNASLFHLMDLLNNIKVLKFCFKKKEPLDCVTCLQSFWFEQSWYYCQLLPIWWWSHQSHIYIIFKLVLLRFIDGSFLVRFVGEKLFSGFLFQIFLLWVIWDRLTPRRRVQVPSITRWIP